MKFAVAVVATTIATLAWAQDPKPAEQVYKNITHFKGTPADQILPAMQFMASALNVQCDFCHVGGKPEADDKPAKKTARDMIAMTMNINKTSFNGRLQVTCFTCHHGLEHPAGVPPVTESDGMLRPPAPAATGAPTPADEVLAKYTTALGGADALRKVTTRVMKGALSVGGSQTPIEVIAKAPNRRVSISHTANGDSYTAFDGTVGWLGNTGRPAREMSAAESAAAGLDAEFHLALRFKEIFPQVRANRAETIDGVPCNVLTATAPGRPPVRFYFAKESGLLVRLVRYAETPIGRNPTQVDYADYRDVGGAKVPFRWSISRPSGRFTIQIAEAQANVTIDEGRFARPAGEVR